MGSYDLLAAQTKLEPILKAKSLIMPRISIPYACALDIESNKKESQSDKLAL